MNILCIACGVSRTVCVPDLSIHVPKMDLRALCRGHSGGNPARVPRAGASGQSLRPRGATPTPEEAASFEAETEPAERDLAAAPKGRSEDRLSGEFVGPRALAHDRHALVGQQRH